MKRIRLLFVSLTVCTMVAAASGCSVGVGKSPAAATFTDPFTYCAAVGTMDKPDARYTGPAVPDVVINGFKKAVGLESSTEPMEMLRQTTMWRCMDTKVYACNVGANLPCEAKANTDKTPSQAIIDFCKANPDAHVVPMSVTGHETIYSWQCAKNNPQIDQQIAQSDKAGYLQNIWYPIEAGP